MKLNELQALVGSARTPADLQSTQRLFDRMREIGLEPGRFYQELEMDDRYVNTHRDVSTSNMAVQLHSHNFYELLYCCNTCGVEYLVGSQRFRLQKGDIIFVAPGISHRPILPEHMAEPYRRDVLWFSQEFVEFLRDHLTEKPEGHTAHINLLRTAGTKWEYLGELFRKGVLEAECRKPGWELAVLSNSIEIVVNLNRVLGDRHAARLAAEAPSLLDQIMAYMEANLANRITLKDTARQFFVSESTVSHLFQHKMGVSFYRCVTQRRLIAAKALIQRGMPMEEVSCQVGFGDYSTFYRAFKQEYGISPQQYRRLQA